MSQVLLCRARLLLLVGLALLVSSVEARAAVVKAPQVTVKRFTGLLSGSGPVSQSPGQALSPSADWINFICDPKSLLWKIRIRKQTAYINGPRICDHVEVVMFYYDPQQSFPETGPVDGTAISVRRIP